MEKLPEVIQNKIMYLTLSHPIAEMIKHTKWFYELKYRAENISFTISDIQAELGDIEGECIHCGIELHSKEMIICWWCVFRGIKILLKDNTPWVFRICGMCKGHFDINVGCFECDEPERE